MPLPTETVFQLLVLKPCTMVESIERFFSNLPPYAWNLFLALVAIATGYVLRLLFGLFIRWMGNTKDDFSLIRSVLQRLGGPLTWFLPVLIFDLLLPFIKIVPRYYTTLNRVVDITLICTFAAVLVGIINVATDYVFYKYRINKPDNLKERKIRTQLQFIRKLMISLILICTACAVLLSFESLRKIGAGLLTGVGIGGIIIGFAAQRSLANLLAGFQIAFTQPIRIDDVLVVEGEWGRVEEITLTYVVLNIWDQRRLILPINYFIEKPFQNWTRTHSDLLSFVMLYMDYSVPVDAIRKEFNSFIQNHPLWDKRVAVVQVTNTTDKTIEIRLLVSAMNSGQGFDLRCFLREHMIAFIQKNYPDSLPKLRMSIEQPATTLPPQKP
jgi:small-conductance mechanosensitive channel